MSWEVEILEKGCQSADGMNRVGKDEDTLVGVVE